MAEAEYTPLPDVDPDRCDPQLLMRLLERFPAPQNRASRRRSPRAGATTSIPTSRPRPARSTFGGS